MIHSDDFVINTDGLSKSFGEVRVLQDVGFREQASRLEVPIYFLEGRQDVNAPPELAEDYLQRLEAPHKKLIWFEHSGHSPWVEESEKVMDVMINTILRQRTP